MEWIVDLLQVTIIAISGWAVQRSLRLWLKEKEPAMAVMFIAMGILLTEEILEFFHISLGEFEDLGAHFIDAIPFVIFLMWEFSQRKEYDDTQDQRIAALEQEISALKAN